MAGHHPANPEGHEKRYPTHTEGAESNLAGNGPQKSIQHTQGASTVPRTHKPINTASLHDIADARYQRHHELTLLLRQPNLPQSGDPDLDMDVFLTAQSMISARRTAGIDLSPLDAASDEALPMVLSQILQTLETEHHFTCAIIDDTGHSADGHEDTIAITEIFTLAKHPDWMGLSLSLHKLQGHHVRTHESQHHPGSPGVMIAVPDIMMSDQPDWGQTPPQAGFRILADIAAWHGASSFQWFPAAHQP